MRSITFAPVKYFQTKKEHEVCRIKWKNFTNLMVFDITELFAILANVKKHTLHD